MFFAELLYGIEVKRISKCVRHHDGASFRSNSFTKAIRDRVVGSQFNIDYNGLESILNNWIDSGGESHRDGEYFIARLQGSFVESRAGQRA